MGIFHRGMQQSFKLSQVIKMCDRVHRDKQPELISLHLGVRQRHMCYSTVGCCEDIEMVAGLPCR